MEKLDEKGGGCKARGGSEGGSYTLRQVGVALGFAVLLTVVVAQAVWSQHQWREMGERIEALERKGPALPVTPDANDETTTFIIVESKDRECLLMCDSSPGDAHIWSFGRVAEFTGCTVYGERPSAHLVPACSVSPYSILTTFFSTGNIRIIQNFWAENNTCPPRRQVLHNHHMTGGMSLHNGSILMVPCQGLYYVYAQMGLKQDRRNNDTVAITLTKVCFNTSTPQALILEKYVMPTPHGGFPFLAGTFNMTCDCGFALSTPLLPQLKITASSQWTYFGAFLVDGVLPGGPSS